MKLSLMTTLYRTAVSVMLAVSVNTTAALAGATMPDTLKSGEMTLKLNGLGLRKKAMIKVYVAGLYLELPSKDAQAILAADQGKAIRTIVCWGANYFYSLAVNQDLLSW